MKPVGRALPEAPVGFVVQTHIEIKDSEEGENTFCCRGQLGFVEEENILIVPSRTEDFHKG